MFYIEEEKVCEVGDVFYRVIKGEITRVTITRAEKMQLGHYVYKDSGGRTIFNRNFGEYIFKTKEDAEKHLKRKEMIAKKKEMLKEYEDKLNQQLGITRHYFIK